MLLITAAPAVGDDGTIFVGDVATGRFAALTCRGLRRWTFDTRDAHFNAPGSHQIHGSGALAEDGKMFVGTFFGFPSMMFALRPDGTFPWDPMLPVSGADSFSHVFGSPAIDGSGRVFAGTIDLAFTIGRLIGFNPAGKPLPGFPVDVNNVPVSPVVLANGAVVFASDANPDPPSPPPAPTASTGTPIRRMSCGNKGSRSASPADRSSGTWMPRPAWSS